MLPFLYTKGVKKNKEKGMKKILMVLLILVFVSVGFAFSKGQQEGTGSQEKEVVYRGFLAEYAQRILSGPGGRCRCR